MCPKISGQTWLPAKLSAGDLVAQEAKYHVQCLANLYNKARERKTAAESDTKDGVNHRHGIAFPELVSYIAVYIY